MNRRQFIAASVVACTTPIFAKENFKDVKVPALKSGLTFELECYNLNSWLKNSLFESCYYPTNLDENTASVLVCGDDVIRMCNSRGYACQLHKDEPLESIISRSVNDLADSIYDIEGRILVQDTVKPIHESKLKNIDVSINEVLNDLAPDITDAYISKVLFDRFFSHLDEACASVLSGNIKVHKCPWMDSCFAEYCPPEIEPYYGQCNIALVNRRKGKFIRFVPYSHRFVTVHYELFERSGMWGVTTTFLHAAKKFDTDVHTGLIDTTITESVLTKHIEEPQL